MNFFVVISIVRPMLHHVPGGNQWFTVLFLLGMGLVTGLYLLGMARLWQRAGIGHGLRPWQVLSFLGADLLSFIALVSPLSQLADQYFSLHMIQHMLLILPIPVLILESNVYLAYWWSLPHACAHRLGGWWAKIETLHAVWRILTQPWIAWSLFTLCFWIWHFPAFYQFALNHDPVHILEHSLFFVTAIIFFTPLIKRSTQPAKHYGTAILYSFVTMLQMSALGGLLTFSSQPWYPYYAFSPNLWGLSPLWYPGYAFSPNLWGLSPLQDQQLGGLIMWLPGGLVFTSLMVIYAGAFIKALEKQVHRRESRLGMNKPTANQRSLPVITENMLYRSDAIQE